MTQVSEDVRLEYQKISALIKEWNKERFIIRPERIEELSIYLVSKGVEVRR